jgi:hypothetical protein
MDVSEMQTRSHAVTRVWKKNLTRTLTKVVLPVPPSPTAATTPRVQETKHWQADEETWFHEWHSENID